MANLIIEMPDDLVRSLAGIAAAQRKSVPMSRGCPLGPAGRSACATRGHASRCEVIVAWSLSLAQVRRLLGLATRWEAQQFLGSHGSRSKTCNSQELQDGGLVYTE